MPLTLRAPRPPKSPNYEIRGTYLGVPVERSTRTADKKLAARIKKQIEREIEAGIFTPKGGMTFLGAAVAYMKAGGERTFLGPIIEYDGAYSIRDKPITTVVQADLDHIAAALYPNNTTASKNRAVYTPIIAVLRRNGVERRFQRPRGAQGKRSKSFLEYDQAFALLDEADKVDLEFGALCTTCLYTGRRIGDLLNPNTKLRNLNLRSKEPTLYIGKTKNGDPVTVPLPQIVVDKLKAIPPRKGVAFLERDPDARLFRFHQGGHLRAMLAQAMANADLSFPKRERGFHLFCHTFATWCIRGGMDNYALARTGRWKDPRSVAPYIHNLTSQEAKRAVNLLPTPIRGQSGCR
jgi:integrase